MRSRLAVLMLALALLGAGCQDDGNDVLEETDTAGEDFTLTGVVVDAKAGVQPDPDEEDAEDAGGIAVRPDSPEDAENLDDCETTEGSYVTYYTPETEFEPADLRDADRFPDSLEGQHVLVSGTIENPAEDEDAEATDDADETDDAEEDDDADDCALFLDDVALVEDSDATDDGGAVGGTGGTASPGPSGSPDVTTEPGSTPGLPEGVEDTDPIFEGTPDPDECEGQKACREED